MGQNESMKKLINETQQKLEMAESKLEQSKSKISLAIKTTETELFQKLLADVAKISVEMKQLSDQAEAGADKIEVEAKKTGCFTGAAEADDAEDYCRQLGYYTFEIAIYAQKASKEAEKVYVKEYLYKAQNYCEQSYEAIKNAKLELADALKDLSECE
jgi:hypothetical protein